MRSTKRGQVTSRIGGGFNIPSSALSPFYEGHFSPLTDDESRILEFFRYKRALDFYIIATADDSDPSLLRHEIAHALYYLNPDYKKEADAVLAGVDTAPIKKFLTEHPDYGEYHPKVLDDEVHAYLAHSNEEMQERGINLDPYRETIKKLQALYERYAPLRG